MNTTKLILVLLSAMATASGSVMGASSTIERLIAAHQHNAEQALQSAQDLAKTIQLNEQDRCNTLLQNATLMCDQRIAEQERIFNITKVDLENQYRAALTLLETNYNENLARQESDHTNESERLTNTYNQAFEQFQSVCNQSIALANKTATECQNNFDTVNQSLNTCLTVGTLDALTRAVEFGFMGGLAVADANTLALLNAYEEARSNVTNALQNKTSTTEAQERAFEAATKLLAKIVLENGLTNMILGHLNSTAHDMGVEAEFAGNMTYYVNSTSS